MSRVGALRHFFHVPPASERVPDWHVAPAVDIFAYHFSWVWLLGPLLLCGDRHAGDYFALFVVLMAVNFVHRHFTLPYVYLDRGVFSRFPLRFTLVPLVLIAGFLATPWIDQRTIPAGVVSLGRTLWPASAIPGALLVAGVAFVAGAWNLWHVLMQKFGILRVYAAKSLAAGGGPIPRWVDRLFLLGPLPFLVLHLGTRYRQTALDRFPEAGEWLETLLTGLGRAEPWLWPACSALLVASLAIFFRFEWRVSGLGNRPRLSMAAGLLALSSGFLLFNPVKVYMAYAFSHGVEYIVFVWAYQRRHYREPAARRSLLGRLHERPWLAYPAFALGLTACFLLLNDWGRHNLWGVPELELGGASIGLWLFYWSVYQSLLHFYYDGFLWKARRADYRAAL